MKIAPVGETKRPVTSMTDGSFTWVPYDRSSWNCCSNRSSFATLAGAPGAGVTVIDGGRLNCSELARTAVPDGPPAPATTRTLPSSSAVALANHRVVLMSGAADHESVVDRRPRGADAPTLLSNSSGDQHASVGQPTGDVLVTGGRHAGS